MTNTTDNKSVSYSIPTKSGQLTTGTSESNSNNYYTRGDIKPPIEQPSYSVSKLKFEKAVYVRKQDKEPLQKAPKN